MTKQIAEVHAESRQTYGWPRVHADNAMMESFWGTLQLEVLDTNVWQTREELANVVFEWIECFYNPKRRHSSIGMHSPVMFEALHQDPDHDH